MKTYLITHVCNFYVNTNVKLRLIKIITALLLNIKLKLLF